MRQGKSYKMNPFLTGECCEQLCTPCMVADHSWHVQDFRIL
uniref:Uncharacterized protein n=1 Tax=Anguilla anguilla TaxID=7936 RepID=A0A0E9TIC7_ANGAN